MSAVAKGKRRTAFYAVRVTAGQELNVALLMEMRANSMKLPVGAIVVPPGVKGYVIVEAPGIHVVYSLASELKHVKGTAAGMVSPEELERLISPKPILEEVKEGELVEVVAGPFRGLKAQVLRVNKAKGEVTLNILEAAYPLQVTVPGDYIRPLKRGER